MQMNDPQNILEIRDLQTCFFTDRGIVRSVDGVSFSVPAGKTVAVVGESGCGKSVTSLSVMGLLQRPQGKIIGGSILLNTGNRVIDLATAPESTLRVLRGGVMSMIFQEPMTALNPVLTIGHQIGEAVRLHQGHLPKNKLHTKVYSLLEQVGIRASKDICKAYPHQPARKQQGDPHAAPFAQPAAKKGAQAEKAHGGGKVQRQKLIRPAEKLLKGHLQNGPGV